MTEKNLTLGNKIKMIVSNDFVFWVSIILNILYIILFFGLNLLSKANLPNNIYGAFVIYLAMAFPSFLISILFVLFKNNTVQDYVSGIVYTEKVKIRLIIKVLIKHVLLIISFNIFLMPFGTYFNSWVYFLFPFIFDIIDKLTILISKEGISFYNIIVGIKKRAYYIK